MVALTVFVLQGLFVNQYASSFSSDGNRLLSPPGGPAFVGGLACIPSATVQLQPESRGIWRPSSTLVPSMRATMGAARDKVSLRAQEACKDASILVGASASSMLVQQLPQSINGVFFFENGFSQCVEAAAGRKVEVDLDRDVTSHRADSEVVLRWNQQRQQLECGSDLCQFSINHLAGR